MDSPFDVPGWLLDKLDAFWDRRLRRINAKRLNHLYVIIGLITFTLLMLMVLLWIIVQVIVLL